MHIVFGWGLDGHSYPPTATGCAAAIGQPVVGPSDRLHHFVTERWPRARWRREVPIFGCLNNQQVSGRIDLLIETDEGCVILDHKTFPGAPDTWAEKALSFAPQIALYRRIVADAVARPILASFIHMPVVGMLIRIEPIAAAHETAPRTV
jgi:ATP-dependent helicase/nuclease subunit A